MLTGNLKHELLIQFSCYMYTLTFLDANVGIGAKDCTDIFNSNPESPSGQYQVWLSILGQVTVFCDMATDGGGWTVKHKLNAFSISSVVTNDN